MRLFLLRHEERPKEVGFYTELTEEGKKNSINKVKQLEKLNIDKIFCSPFIRCVQTIEPFCLKHNKFIPGVKIPIKSKSVIKDKQNSRYGS